MDYLAFYQDCMYGQWRTGEEVSYRLEEEQLTIFVTTREKQVSFRVKLFLPEEATKEKFGGKFPVLVCMHPIQPKDYLVSEGYAVVVLDTLQVASDDCKHNGCFYELYPYTDDPKTQTGVLMAWGWAASKVLDAMEAGLAAEKNLDQQGTIVTGVSRWGKATAVCGAFEKRFTMVMPACSGAGGLALNAFRSEGKIYNLEGVGGPAEYTYGQNEPLNCLQSEAERGWFNDAFLAYQTPEEIPVDQYMLPVLAADAKRFYFIIAACMGEDWVNAPAMWACYKKANEEYEKLGLANHLVVNFHKEGHAVLLEDATKMVAYFNKMHYGLAEEVNMNALKSSVFERQE